MERRNFMSAMALLSLTSFAELAGCSRAKCDGAPIRKLNVLLHGSFACVIHLGAYVALLTPNLGDKHQYSAGTFKEEKPLNLGHVYLLTGVANGSLTGAATSTVSSKLMVFSMSQLSLSVDLSTNYCIFLLPTPNEIYPINCIQPSMKGQQFFTTIPRGTKQPDQLGLTVALTYKNLTGCPQLVDLFGNMPLWTAQPKKSGIANLHIRSERTARKKSKDHFDKLLQLLPPLADSLKLNDTPVVCVPYDLPEGVDSGEEYALATLDLGLIRHGSLFRSLEDCAESDEPSNCQTIVGTRP